MNKPASPPTQSQTALLLRTAGYAIYLYLALDIVAFSGLLLFTIFGPPYDNINTGFGAITPLALLPAVISITLVQRSTLYSKSVVSMLVGIIGALGSVIVSFLFWFKLMDEPTFLWSSSLGYGMIGIWQILIAVAASMRFVIYHRLAGMTLITGTAIVLLTIFLLLQLAQSSVFIGLFIVVQICSPVWAAWLGHALLQASKCLAPNL